MANKDIFDELYGSGSPQDQANGQKIPWLNDALQIGGAVGGGIIGNDVGAAAGALIPGLNLSGIPEAAGAYAGGVAGAGIVAGAGNYAADYIRQNLLGDKTVRPEATIPNSIEAGKIGAAGQAIGVPFAKGLGILAHPIAPLIDRVDTLLAKSPKTVDLGKMLLDFRNNALPSYNKHLVGGEAKAAFDNLSTRLNQAASEFNQLPPVEQGMKTVQNTMEIPISAANAIKRNLYSLVETQGGKFGEMGNTEQQITKHFASLLKDHIETQVPGVKLPNKVASAAYKVPDTLNTLSDLLAFGGQRQAAAISKVASLPFNAIQKVIPAGGGYLSKLLPALIQSGAIGLNGLNQ